MFPVFIDDIRDVVKHPRNIVAYFGDFLVHGSRHTGRLARFGVSYGCRIGCRFRCPYGRLRQVRGVKGGGHRGRRCLVRVFGGRRGYDGFSGRLSRRLFYCLLILHCADGGGSAYASGGGHVIGLIYHGA